MKRRPSAEDASLSKGRDLKRAASANDKSGGATAKDKDESRQPQSPPFLSTGNA